MSWKKGEAPWERNQPSSFKVGSAPWEQNSPPKIDDSSPDWLSTGDRLIAKNFSQSPEKTVEFLKKQYPGKEFQIQDGEVLAKDPKDASWQKLDPGFHPIDNPLQTLKDLPADIGDLGYDLASGAAQGLATTAGAIGGAFAGGGVGAIPGAMAASGLSGAGLEALRQKLGQQLGIPQDVDGTDVAVSGVAGTISPLLFGAGKATTGVVSNAARKLGANEALLQTAENAGRGVGERGWDAAKNTVFPYIGEKASGISRDSIRTLSNNLDAVENLEKNGVTDYVKGITNKVNSTLSAEKDRAGKAVQSAIDSSGSPVDVSKAKQAFQDRIRFLESRPELTNAEQAEINSLKETYIKYFGLAKGVAPEESAILSDPQLKTLYTQLDSQIGNRSLSNPAQVAEQVGNSVLQNQPKALPPPTSNWGRNEILENITNPNNRAVNQSVGGFINETNNEILGHAGLLREEQEALAQAYASKNQSMINEVLAKIEARRNQFIADNTRTEVKNQVDAGRAFDLQKKLRQAAQFESDMTPETLSAKGSARNAYGEINKSLDSATSGLSSDAKADYKRYMDIEDVLGSSFADDQKTFNTMTGLDKRGRTILRERLQKLANSGELDLSKEAEVLQNFKDFGNPSMSGGLFKSDMNLIRKGAGATIGGGLGYMAGSNTGGQTGGTVGAATGAAIGTALTSPAALRAIIKANLKANEAAKLLQPPGGAGQYLVPIGADVMSPWLKMQFEK